MKLPQEIKILNHIYKVMEVDEIKDDSPTANPEEVILGTLDDQKLQILVVKSIQPSRKYQIFLHELVHAMFNIIDLKRYLKDPEVEESLVNFLSDILLQTLTDNALKFPKKYKKLAFLSDKELMNNILSNHGQGVSVSEICRTFQVSEHDVRQLIKLKGKVKKKTKIKKSH
jgi:predicted AAA+ superfamily ATPase